MPEALPEQLEALLDRLVEVVESAKPQECSNALWALAKVAEGRAAALPQALERQLEALIGQLVACIEVGCAWVRLLGLLFRSCLRSGWVCVFRCLVEQWGVLCLARVLWMQCVHWQRLQRGKGRCCHRLWRRSWWR